MSTIQEAYKGVLAGEKWRLPRWPQDSYIFAHSDTATIRTPNGTEYLASKDAVCSDDWERVPPPARPMYLMLPCADKAGGHYLDSDGIRGGYRSDRPSYRQVAFLLTVDDLSLFERLLIFPPGTMLPESLDRLDRIRETLKPMKEAQ